MADVLRQTFNQTTRRLAGHGPRTIQSLQEAIAPLDGSTPSDMYGKGAVIEAFQAKMARLLGKDAAVFFPSGTMAQQIALRIWCEEKGLKRVAYHPLCHLEIHEQDGLKELHQIETVLLADKTRVIELDDVRGMGNVACLLLELPQREIGGQLPSFQTLEAIAAYCRQHGVRLHLDGARLLEVLPYYEKTAAEICALFDSVYISFYKGLGGIAGAILAGEQVFTERAKIWKRRYGGDLISLYPYILSSDYYYEKRAGNMGLYYQHARELAAWFNACEGVTTLPLLPVSNMFHVHFQQPKEQISKILSEVQCETNIGVAGHLVALDDMCCAFEVSVGDQYGLITREEIAHLFAVLREKMS
ncbi:MAG TPA: beta-eliminating lyase-related protein [Symbiobacteriaceae bacterium]|nr:beta-eliminating lyase-related protein [Symbiobacteriaceae bacterium]